MPSGGARPGAGNKKGVKFKKTMERELAQQVMREWILDKMPEILGATFARAMGVSMVSKVDGSIYKELPSVEAQRLLIEHAVGKPTTKVDMKHSGEIAQIELTQEQRQRIAERILKNGKKT